VYSVRAAGAGATVALVLTDVESDVVHGQRRGMQALCSPTTSCGGSEWGTSSTRSSRTDSAATRVIVIRVLRTECALRV